MRVLLLISSSLLLLFPVACRRGGGGGARGGASGPQVALVAIEFPDSSGLGEDPPVQAPLVQSVVFRFSGRPHAATVHARSLQVKDAAEVNVAGSYRVVGNDVVFQPNLPVRALDLTASPIPDRGGLSLLPGTTYFVEVQVGGTDSVANLVGFSSELAARYRHPVLSHAVLASFTTTTDETRYLLGLDVQPVQIARVTPTDGFASYAPFLYGDPNDLFPANQPIVLELDGPVHPGADNVGEERLRLLDLDDTSVSPEGLALGVRVSILENTATGSRIEVRPAGILPLGHMLALEVPSVFRHLSDPLPPVAGSRFAASYWTATSGNPRIEDRFEERFVDPSGLDAEASAASLGIGPAEWSLVGSGHIIAASAFPGTGVLGDFKPPTPSTPTQVTLDTSVQSFPLLDGSTPGAPAGTVVEGGVFHFRDIDIPAGITLKPVGPNPLILTATGTVRLAGTIDLRGLTGNSDSSYDSAISPIAGGKGGAGGGRGGVSHPSHYFPPGQFGIMNLIPPPKGEDGFGPLVGGLPTPGGQGGTSAVVDDPTKPNPEIFCDESTGNDPSRGAHGGGGSYLTRGKRGRPGAGNMNATADGGYIDTLNTVAPPGTEGPPAFSGKASDDFIGPTGEIKVIRGGQGGGGGGTKLEGYYCGFQMPWGRNEFNGLFPDTTGDARGGGGGGGGGAVEIRAQGVITLAASALINADGGAGGAGEVTATSSFGGGGGGGSGGGVILKSAADVQVHGSARILLRGGGGDLNHFRNLGTGGDGLVQIQVPVNQVPTVGAAVVVPASSYIDPQNLRNPVEFGPRSRVVSRWIDLGRTIARPSGGARFQFSGTDVQTGKVITDSAGNILLPDQQSFEIDYLGRINPRTGDYFSGEEPREDWVPPEASVTIEFQAADAVAPGSREVDEANASAWTADWTQIGGRQFVRWRVTFHLAEAGQPLTEASKRPVLQRLSLDFDF